VRPVRPPRTILTCMKPRRPQSGAKKRGKSSTRPTMREKILAAIREIPPGMVRSYGGVAKAAGFPRHARHVVATLRTSFGLPWHRVLGAGGEIKLRGDHAIEQRLRLQAEGVVFRGRKVDMKRHEFRLLPPQRQTSRTQSSGAKKKKRKSQA
jgi:methylated-DNA-protein-cysteine methyltransferase related protein